MLLVPFRTEMVVQLEGYANTFRSVNDLILVVKCYIHPGEREREIDAEREGVFVIGGIDGYDMEGI